MQAWIADSAGTSVDVAISADPDTFAATLLRSFARRDAPAPRAPTSAATLRVTLAAGNFRYDGPTTLPVGASTLGLDASAGAAFSLLIGRIGAGHTYADVLQEIAVGVRQAPTWFTVVATLDVPGGARPTYVFDLDAGRYAVLAAHRDGSGLIALAQIVVA